VEPVDQKCINVHKKGRNKILQCNDEINHRDGEEDEDIRRKRTKKREKEGE
jgi:hypothetical protein